MGMKLERTARFELVIGGLEGPCTAIVLRPRCPRMELNHRRAGLQPTALPLSYLGIWLRVTVSRRPLPGYEPEWTLGLPASNGRRRGYRTHPLQPVRPFSRGYKPHPLTRADARMERGKGVEPSTSTLARSRSATELPPRIGGGGETRTHDRLLAKQELSL